MQTRLTELLGCKYPIIQTAMGWVADAKLVAATGEAGGFGFLAGAVMTLEEIEQGILDIKSMTEAPFGVNFHMYVPHADAIVDLCIEHRVRAVSYSRSPAGASIEKLKSAGIVCIPTVGAYKHAIKAVELGADALVVQGGEGGGHTGSVATTILLGQLKGRLSVPYAAAGGFRDGAGLIAAMALGADGIAMGTRFLLTEESPVPAKTKSVYLGTPPEEIVVSTRLDGLPQRMIANGYLRSLTQATVNRAARQSTAQWLSVYAAYRRLHVGDAEVSLEHVSIRGCIPWANIDGSQRADDDSGGDGQRGPRAWYFAFGSSGGS